MYYVDFGKAVVLPGGGGGYSHFFFICRLWPSIYCSPNKNIRNFKDPKNDIWNFTNPKKYLPFFILTLRKDPKMHRNNP